MFKYLFIKFFFVCMFIRSLNVIMLGWIEKEMNINLVKFVGLVKRYKQEMINQYKKWLKKFIFILEVIMFVNI